MSYRERLESNNADLQTILDTVNALPEAGGSGIVPTGTMQITENGTYDVTEYASVVVDVPSDEPVTAELTVTENGTYTPGSGVDGFSKVTVNVPSSGGGGGSAETCTVTFDLSKTSENSIYVYYATTQNGAVALGSKRIEATTSITVIKNTPMIVQYDAYDEFSNLIPTANASVEIMFDMFWGFTIAGDATIAAGKW